MTILTPTQLAMLAKAAGFAGDQISTAVAIAMSESGGNSAAHNTNAATGDDSYGPWQINMKGDLGPDRRKTYGLKADADLLNPVINARVAYGVSSHGTNWTPWSDYKNGHYSQYLSEARRAASEADRMTSAGLDDFIRGIGGGLGLPQLGDIAGAAQDQIAAAGGVAGALASIGQSVSGMASTVLSVGKLADGILRLMLPTNLLRLAMGIAGFTFVFIGIFLLGREVTHS